jgi:hypothetical protein
MLFVAYLSPYRSIRLSVRIKQLQNLSCNITVKFDVEEFYEEFF